MKRSALWILLGLLALPRPAWAIFGVGDVVIDPENIAQTINVLSQVKQEYERMGSLLNVSTQQLSQLLALASALGNKSEAAQLGTSQNPNELQALIRQIPGLESANLSSLFTTTGQLDAFMGQKIGDWDQAIRDPGKYYMGILTSSARDRASIASSDPSPSATYYAWLSARPIEDQASTSRAFAGELTNLLAEEWLKSSKQRLVNLQALASANHTQAANADAAGTVSDSLKVQSALASNANQILLESSINAVNANESILRSISDQASVGREQNAIRRDSAILELETSR